MTAGRHHVVSIPAWAAIAGLADDARSMAAMRKFIADGQGPELVEIKRQTRNGPVAVEGVNLRDHEMWTRSNPWAEYLAALSASEREKRKAQAMSIVGDAAYGALLYERYCASRWRLQMTFEKWVRRRQRLKDRHSPRKTRRAAKGGSR